jgi:hypothetical protein
MGMSRAVLLLLMLSSSPVAAQTPPQSPEGDVAQLVKTKADEIVTVEYKKKCPEPVEGEEIVVCAEVDNGEDQLIFDDQRVRQESGAATNANAAACIPGTGCTLPFSGGVQIGFGKRRPPAIPYEEFLKGLPEPDAVPPEEGSADAAVEPERVP